MKRLWIIGCLAVGLSSACGDSGTTPFETPAGRRYTLRENHVGQRVPISMGQVDADCELQLVEKTLEFTSESAVLERNVSLKDCPDSANDETSTWSVAYAYTYSNGLLLMMNEYGNTTASGRFEQGGNRLVIQVQINFEYYLHYYERIS